MTVECSRAHAGLLGDIIEARVRPELAEKHLRRRQDALADDEQGVSLKAIAERIGSGLELPARSITGEEAPGDFGWWGDLASNDLKASSFITRRKLGWNLTGPGLLADLDAMDYSRAA